VETTLGIVKKDILEEKIRHRHTVSGLKIRFEFSLSPLGSFLPPVGRGLTG
jgi:hypothetical protein